MTDIDIGYNLDASGYLAGINAIDAANARVQGSIGSVTTSSTALSKALSLVTPGRATIAGMGLLAQQAAQVQQAMSGLAATSTVTGVNVGKLGTGIRQMARDMPLGSNASRALVEQFTKMGVAGAGSEAKILKLSTSVAKLSGATGEGPGQLAQGMTELARATGNTNLDPKRFENLSDSLTTISAKSGASATSILAFSKSIAPMAQASGIGATGVLGISSAFSRLGEDGLGASTAVNKMLSDMNRAVREGSPEMKTYAQMAGKTTEEFSKLFKMNPAEALTQVTEAVAKAGPGGPRMLEQIGIEGVRGQRSLQALSASGGLRPAIAAATAAYGTGSTEEASKAAFGGLNDSMTQLGESTEQVAEALGAPLLGPLTLFTDALGTATGGLAKLLNSGPIQAIMKGGVIAGVGALALKSVVAPIGALALGRQAVTSGPVGAAIAGYLSTREGANRQGRAARFSTPLAEAEGKLDPVSGKTVLRTGAFGGARGAAYDIAVGLAQSRNRKQGVGAFEDPNAPQRPMGPMTQAEAMFEDAVSGKNRPRVSGTRLALSTLHETAGTYAGMTANQLKNSFRPAMDRDPSWGFTDRVKRSWESAQNANNAGNTGNVDAAKKATRAFAETMTEADKTIGKAAKETSASLWDVAKASGNVVKQAGKDVKAGADAAADAIGGWKEAAKGGAIALGVTAATTLVTMGLDKAGEQKADRESFLDKDISSTINAYRESIGKATDTTQTFGSMSEALQKQLAATAKQSTFADVRNLTDADIAAANDSKDKTVTTYAGDAKEIAAQVIAASPQGVTPDELQAIKVDLARQLPKTVVRDVLKALPDTFEAGKGNEMTTEEMNKVISTVAGQASAGEDKPWYAGALTMQAPTGGTNDLQGLDTAAQMPGWLRTITGQKGGGTDISSLGEASKAQIDAVSQGVAQGFAKNQEKYGTGYAEQERTKQINAGLAQAVKEGNADVFMELSNAAGQQMGGDKFKDVVWSPAEFEKAGGKFEEVVAGYDETYREGLRDMQEQQRKAGGQIKPELIEQAYTKAIRPESAFLGDVFDVRSKSDAAVAMQKSMAAPEDVALQEAAYAEAVAGAKAAGKSMTDLATESVKAAGAVAEGGDAWVRLQGIQARAQFTMQTDAVRSGMTPGNQAIQQLNYSMSMAQVKPVDEATKAQAQQGKEGLLAAESSAKERMAGRLMVQRNFEIASARMNEDFERQQLYSKKDYDLQVFRLERNAGIQRERAQYSFHLQAERAEEDFARSRTRILRDFAIAAGRAEKDYLTARSRQIRDFNIGLKRQIEDAAKSMYDPYDRIQTKATWDTANLLVNMQSQTDAMKKQKDQLDELRKMGLSAQTIDILGLGKAENAQQLNNIMSDASPENIAALNAAAKERAGAAGDMYLDESNTDLKRSREDLAKGLADQEADYLKSVKRSQADLAKSLRDSSADFTRAMRRSSDDFKRNLRNAQDDLHTTLKDMATDRDTSMARAEDALGTQLSRMTEDIANADQIIAGNIETLAAETNKAIHGKAVNWQKIMSNDTASWVTKMQSDVIPKMNDAYKAMGITAKDVAAASGSVTAQPGYTGSEHSNRALGGPIGGSSPHDKADNVHVMATAGEFMQPVKAVNYYGPKFMEDVRTLKYPRQALAEGGMVYKDMERWMHKNLPGVAITSSYRSPSSNAAAGGSKTSMHLQGKALDVAPSMGTFDRILGSFGKNIYQLFYGPANGRTILKGKPWTMPPTLAADHFDHVHWAMQTMAGMTGMDPDQIAAIIAKMPNKGPFQKALSQKVAAALRAKLAMVSGDAGGDTAGPAYSGEDATSRWTANVNNVLRMLGRPLAEAGAVLRRIDFESNGNPRAINNWDSNAKKGTPSKGLMQVIDPTFAAYRGRSLPNNIWDPTANIYAGSHYAIRRYGSLAAIDPRNRPKGYDDGGWMPTGHGEHVNGTAKPEAVLTDDQWRDIHRVAAMVTADDLRGVNAARGAHIVVNNQQSYLYDYSNDYDGAQITVQSNDPDEMGRKLTAKAVTARVTQTRGVRR